MRRNPVDVYLDGVRLETWILEEETTTITFQEDGTCAVDERVSRTLLCRRKERGENRNGTVAGQSISGRY